MPDSLRFVVAGARTRGARAIARWLALGLAALLLVVGGGSLLTSDGTEGDPAMRATVDRATTISAESVPPAPVAAEPSAHVEAAPPEQVTVSSVDIDAPVAPYTDADVQANDGWVEPPTPEAVSWWAGGGTPASDAENTVYLYGHVSRRPAVFNSLHEVQPGAVVSVRTADGTLAYTVSEVLEPVAKESLPSDERVSAAVPGRLVLIGCHRDADQGDRPTTHNTVVIAQLTSACPRA